MSQPLKDVKNTEFAYRNNQDYIGDQLRKLDTLIRQRTLAIRRNAPTAASNDLASVYISHDEVDHLLNPDSFAAKDGDVRAIQESAKQQQHEIQVRVAQSAREGVFLALPQLAHVFSLSPFEVETLVICLA